MHSYQRRNGFCVTKPLSFIFSIISSYSFMDVLMVFMCQCKIPGSNDHHNCHFEPKICSRCRQADINTKWRSRFILSDNLLGSKTIIFLMYEFFFGNNSCSMQKALNLELLESIILRCRIVDKWKLIGKYEI